MSGSEDTNVRVWKDDPSRKIGPSSLREKRAVEYRKSLIKKFKYLKEIKRLKKEHMPKMIYNHKKKLQAMSESRYRKREKKMKNEVKGYYVRLHF